MKSVSFVLRETFHLCLMRIISTQVVFFPEFARYFVLPGDREIHGNIMKLRELLLKYVKERRELINSGNKDNRGDLLEILLTDELFKDNDKMIIDECLTFFFAAT